jgi:deoxyxylulose-5-phosphate synthase
MAISHETFSFHTLSAQVAKELRADLIYQVSQTGGHLGSR